MEAFFAVALVLVVFAFAGFVVLGMRRLGLLGGRR